MAVRIGPTPTGFPVTPLNLTEQVKRSEIDVKHADWLLYSEAWYNTCIMYEGEPLISKNAERFLQRKPKEDSAAFQHRLDLFTYENHMGTGLGYYEAEMFDTDPEINILPKDKATNAPVSDGKISTEQDQFYNQRFLKNCDRAGTPLLDKFQDVYQYTLLYGAAWVLDDLPRPDPNAPPVSLKEQQDQKLLDPYKVLYAPIDIINWESDEEGNLAWAVIFVTNENQTFLGKPMITDRWTYFDKQQYLVYEQTYEKEASTAQVQALQDTTPVYLVAAGYHVMAKYNTLPLQHIPISNGWWLARRAYSPARKHINVSNALDWSLQMAALSIPIVFTDQEVSQIAVSEVGFLVFGQEDRFEYAEPDGKSWAELGKREVSLKEAIFRAMFLISMARGTSSTAAAQSGVSKQQDMAPSQSVLSGMGAVLRAAMQECIERTMKVRAAIPGFEADADITVDVRGFTFEDKTSVEEIDVIQTVLDMDIPSDTLEKEAYNMTARAFLKNANPDVLQTIHDEIAAAPNKADRDMAAQQQQLDMRQQTLRTNITNRLKDPIAKEAQD